MAGRQQSPRQLARDRNASADTAERMPARYTCPMHPEVLVDRPVSCPKCGMALERNSEHHLAAAIITGAEQRNLGLSDIQ